MFDSLRFVAFRKSIPELIAAIAGSLIHIQDANCISVAVAMSSKADPNSRITDFDDVPSAKPLPLESQLGGTEVARRHDSATGDLAFISQNNKLDVEYQLPGGGQNSRGTWVSVHTAAGLP